jgi:hypothetical protein
MVRVKLVAFALAGISLAGLAGCNRPAANTAATADAPGAAPVAAPAKLLTANATDADKIASAMTAAPRAIAEGATIVDMGPGGMRELRKGTNNFTCMADSPTTPGPDPMCGDANGMAFIDAWANKKTPANKPGILYMLEGGTDASNTDPYATAPSGTNNWIKTGPHMMLVGAPDALAGYPTDANPDTSKPYVMWPGTPYAHLMIPIG